MPAVDLPVTDPPVSVSVRVPESFPVQDRFEFVPRNYVFTGDGTRAGPRWLDPAFQDAGDHTAIERAQSVIAAVDADQR